MTEPQKPAAPAAAPAPQPAPAPRKGPPPRLHFNRFKLVEHAHRTHLADIPADIGPETVAMPDYWAHLAEQIRPMDLIVAFWEDSSREVWYRVLFVSPVGVKLSKLFAVDHEPASEEETDDVFKVVFKGGGLKHCVVRSDTGVVLKDRFPTRSEATAFLANYLREMKR
jgi:hypothetical protein